MNKFSRKDFNGQVYKSRNNGDFIVVKYNGYRSVAIKFLATGYEAVTRSTCVRDGTVKDRLWPNVCDIGYVGVGRHEVSTKGAVTKSYKVWTSIIRRCYSPKSLEDSPTYKNCTVAKEWLCFQVFADWFESNYIEGYHIDKDILQPGVGNKVYSANTCLFVTKVENTIEAHAKHWLFKFPNGVIKQIYNLAEFCRDNNFCPTEMRRLHIGEIPSYKGFVKV